MPFAWPQKLDLLCDLFWSRANLRGPQSLNPAEMALATIPSFQMEMNNGCFWAFFYNSSGTFAAETIAALHNIGAPQSADLLSQAVPSALRGSKPT